MKTVFEHSTVNELREMQGTFDRWLSSRTAKVEHLLTVPVFIKGKLTLDELVSAYQLMFTMYAEVSQELKTRLEAK